MQPREGGAKFFVGVVADGDDPRTGEVAAAPDPESLPAGLGRLTALDEDRAARAEPGSFGAFGLAL